MAFHQLSIQHRCYDSLLNLVLFTQNGITKQQGNPHSLITKDNPSLNSTAESIYLSNTDFVIQEQCQRREDAIAHEKYQKEQLSKLSAEIDSLNAEKASLDCHTQDNQN